MRILVFALLAASGCSRPPPAPEGLDASTTFVFRNFYEDDKTFTLGLEGFMEWFFTTGVELVGERANLENTEAFTIGDLSETDVAHLPLDPEILLNQRREEFGPRDLTRAKGVVSLAEMDCTWKDAEALLVRPDQDVVFAGDWEGYDRTYVTSRQTYEEATQTEVFDPVEDGLNPFSESFDPEDYARTLLMTHNMADPTRVLTSNIEEYPLELHLRHGIFDLDGTPTGVFAIKTFNRGAAWGQGGNAALLQSYSIEVNVARPGDKTLRMLAVWAEPWDGSGIIQPDSAIALNFAVNKSLDSSERLSKICAGDIEIEPSP
jgi:hypothetical protein